MNNAHFLRWRILFIALVAMAEVAHLTWEYLHGGVVSHHLLNRADLPAFSNYWGALLLPALAFLTTARVQKRLGLNSNKSGIECKSTALIAAGFFIPLTLGGLLALTFVNGFEELTGYIFVSLFLLAAFLPAYRAESVMGFILAMTFTFGAVLPLLIATMIALMSATIQLFAVPVIVKIWREIMR